MAKLEIHFSTGLVGHAGLARDRPLVLGSHHRCDAVLDEPGVQPVHCRVSWSRGRYRVESPRGSEGLWLNGRPVQSAPLADGDELQIGPVRVRFIAEEAEASPAEAAGKEPPADVGPPSPRPSESAGSPLTRPEWEPAAPTSPSSRRHSSQPADSLSKSGEFPAEPLDDLWTAYQRGEVSPPQAPKRHGSRSGTDQTAPPGQENLLRSPLVLGLGGAVLVLLLLGTIFYLAIFRQSAERVYDMAVTAMGDGLYARAIQLFDQYLKDYPDHRLADQARTLRALSRIRRFTESSTPAWPQALQEAEYMLEEVGHLEAFAEVRGQWAQLVLRIAQQLGDQALHRADVTALEQAERARRLLGGISEEDAEESGLPGLLARARQAIRQYQRRAQTLEAMAAAIEQSHPLAAYDLREHLIGQYPDLADDAEIRKAIRQATEIDRKAVGWHDGREGLSDQGDSEPSRSPQQQEPSAFAIPSNPESLSEDRPRYWQSSVVLAVAPDDSLVRGRSEETLVAVVEGSCYGIDASSGRPLWRRPVGPEGAALTVALSDTAEPFVLLIDRHHRELALAEARTGHLVWRQPIGEPFEADPLILDNQVLMPTLEGDLFVLDLATGRVKGYLTFAQPLPLPPAADPSGQRLYLVGDRSSLYTLSWPELRCEAVHYLGHGSGQVRSQPIRIGPFLAVCQNDRLESCQLRILHKAPPQEGWEQVQAFRLQGWAYRPAAASGNHLWVGTDQAVYVFSVNPTASSEPFVLVSQGNPGEEKGIAPYLLPWAERECWIASSGYRLYSLAAQQQQIDTRWASATSHWITQPIQHLPSAMGFVEHLASQAGVRVTLLENRQLRPLWNLDLGFGVWAPPRPAGDIDSAEGWIALSRTGYGFHISDSALNRGAIITQPLWRLDAPDAFFDRPGIVLRGEGFEVLTTGPGSTEILVWRDTDRRRQRPPQRVRLPATAAATPALMGQGLLVPATDHQLHFIDPDSGEPLALPFQPPLDLKNPWHWRAVEVVAGRWAMAADDHGSLYQVALVPEPVPHLQSRREEQMPSPIHSPLCAVGETVYFVNETDQLVAVRAEDFTTRGEWKLDGGLAGGPWKVAQHVLVTSRSGEAMCFSSDGQLRWSSPLDARPSPWPPALYDDILYVAWPEGRIQALRLEDGKRLWEIATGEPLSTGPMPLNSRLVVAGADGTLHTVALPPTESRH